MAIHEDPEGREVAAFAAAGITFAGRRVLEIGCGDGRLTGRYAHLASSVIAIDPDPDATARLAVKLPAVDARAMTIGDLVLPARSVDVALFAWSL
jgi:16S rRNA A1518/A1519 N6-dimethyltransferase RsmA/KsgA/DIM1 with predicted DNA glycosylase/AP lyase activity